MPVADTSFLVALRNPEDHHHRQALELAKRPGPFLVPAVILAEFLAVAWVRLRATYGTPAADEGARQALADLEAQPVFSIIGTYDAETASRIFTETMRLSYPDAVAVALAQERHEELFTFDKLQKAAADP